MWENSGKIYSYVLWLDQMCFYLQVMFRYLCEEVHVISEKDFIPAVRNLATKLILLGKNFLLILSPPTPELLQ